VEPLEKTPTEAVDYAALNAVWASLTAGLLVGTRNDAPPLQELPVFGLATFALTKALAKEKVGTWVREPLVHETDGRQPKGRRLRYAAGELLTCTRCLGTWSSLALVGLRVARPREGRIVATVLAAAGMNDWLQSGFTLLCSRTNVEERREDLPEARFSRAAAG
jgi:Protein of unknown function (DUF1360)